MMYRDGIARLLRSGQTLRFQMHYNKPVGPGTEVYDDSTLGIIFYKPGEVINHVAQAEVLANTGFVIPRSSQPHRSSSSPWTP